MRRLALLALALALVVAAAAAGPQDNVRRRRSAGRVFADEVVASTAPRAASTPQRIYKDEAPGVVTVAVAVRRRRAAARARASCSTATARSPPTRTWSRPARARRSSARAQVYVEFADGNRVPREDRRARPERRRCAAARGPERVDAAAAAARATARRSTVGEPVAAIGRPFGEPQSLSVGWSRPSTAPSASLTDFRSPARSRPTRRSTPATRAGRWSAPTGA